MRWSQTHQFPQPDVDGLRFTGWPLGQQAALWQVPVRGLRDVAVGEPTCRRSPDHPRGAGRRANNTGLPAARKTPYRASSVAPRISPAHTACDTVHNSTEMKGDRERSTDRRLSDWGENMSRKITRMKSLAVAALLATLFTIFAQTPASAANPRHTCRPLDNIGQCYMEFAFPGGTLSIDIDHWGSPRNDLHSWQILVFTSGGGTYTCGASFWDADPPRSWICRNVPASQFVHLSSGVIWGGEFASLGARW